MPSATSVVHQPSHPPGPPQWKKRPRYVEESRFDDFVWGDFRVVVRHLDQLQKSLHGVNERMDVLEHRVAEMRAGGDRLLERGAAADVSRMLRVGEQQLSEKMAVGAATAATVTSGTVVCCSGDEVAERGNLSPLPAASHAHRMGLKKAKSQNVEVTRTDMEQRQLGDDLAASEKFHFVDHNLMQLSGTSGAGGGTELANRLEVLERAVSELEKTARGSVCSELLAKVNVADAAADSSVGGACAADSAVRPARTSRDGNKHNDEEDAERKAARHDHAHGRATEDRPKRANGCTSPSILASPRAPEQSKGLDEMRVLQTIEHQQESILETIRTKVTSRDDGLLLSRDLRRVERSMNAQFLELRTSLEDKADLDKVNTALALKANLSLAQELKREVVMKADMCDVLVLLGDREDGKDS
eukprot:g1772.t1